MLKKIIILSVFLSTGLVYAKKVKFAVDMTGQTISPNGVHVYGDFQDEAGFPADWDSETTVMTKESSTQIYSVTVNIPAFRKYEYKFVNGDKSYEIEFVPDKSRVGYDFNDNRWIYIDSLDTEVSVLPVLLFGGNAPVGMKMVKFKVDMKTQSAIDGKGVHVAGRNKNVSVSSNFMYSFGNKVHEYIAYTDSLNYEYKFINGDIETKNETITGTCINSNGNRHLKVTSDTILDEVCFSSCTDCPASIFSFQKPNLASLYPNPSQGITLLKINNPNGPFDFSIIDYTGRTIVQYEDIKGNSFSINTNELIPGIYFIEISNNNLRATLKLVVN